MKMDVSDRIELATRYDILFLWIFYLTFINQAYRDLKRPAE